MKRLAAEGRTVFVSSHLMSEMENTADHLIVIGKGKLIADCPTAEFIARSTGRTVRVRTPDQARLADLVTADGGTARDDGDGRLGVSGLTADRIGDLAFENAVRLHELAAAQASLEQAFMELTGAAVEFRAAGSSTPDETIMTGSGV
jgi:ABC-2 type transport system ATP-binding protein